MTGSGDWAARPKTFLLGWGLPLLIVLPTVFIATPSWLATTLWTGAFIWMGLGCVLNARRCHRRHCYISGPVLLLGALTVPLVGLGVVSLGPNGFTIVTFGTILLAGLAMVPEFIWGKYAKPAQGGTLKTDLAAAGGLIGAIAASSCCIVPLVLFALGISGAWIGALTVLAPYQPIFIALTLGFLGYGYYLVYWRPKKTACAGDAACARPLPSRLVKFSLWTASLLVAAALAFPYAAPYFLKT